MCGRPPERPNSIEVHWETRLLLGGGFLFIHRVQGLSAFSTDLGAVAGNDDSLLHSVREAWICFP